MHFLNPEAFWALFLVAIPILIHLFNLRRIKKIYFSNLSFLRDVSQQQKSRSTLKKLLILSCRILALVFLVFAFSRPVFKSDRNQLLENSPIIYLDNSLSLQRTDESGNLLLLNALNAVEGTLSGLTKGNEVGLITNDKSLVRLLPVPKILEELQDVDYSKKSVPLEDIYEKTRRIQADEFWVFSDLQRSTTLPLEPLLNDTTRQITFYSLSSSIERNLYVDTVFLQKPLGIRTQNKLNIGIKNTGEDPASEVLLKVFKNDQQLSSFTINIPPQSVGNVALEVGVNTEMDGAYRIELDDAPIVFDNTYYFSINPVERPIVVILSEGKPNVYLERVYSNEEYFQLIYTSIDNTSFQDIARADLLVLDQLQSIPEWLLSQINKIGGDIFVIPAERIDIDTYATVLGFPIQKRTTARPSTISSGSLEGPFLEGVFNKKNEKMSMPTAKVKYSVSGYFRELIATNIDDPFLVESGKGNVFFLTTPLLDSNTNFQKHALFVPVMYKLAQNRDASRLAYRLDEQTIVVGIDTLISQAIIKLTKGNGSFVPSSRYVNDRLILEVPDVLNEPGIYYLVAEEDTLRSIALNYNRAESEIESIPIDEFKNMISGYNHVQVEEISNVQGFINQKNQAKEQEGLWKYALFLALFFMMSELLLLRFI